MAHAIHTQDNLPWPSNTIAFCEQTPWPFLHEAFLDKGSRLQAEGFWSELSVTFWKILHLLLFLK